DLQRLQCEKTVSMAGKKKVFVSSKWEMVRLGEVCEIIKGVIFGKKDQTVEETKNKVLTADNITIDGRFIIKKIVFLRNTITISKELLLKNHDIFICLSSGSIKHVG